MTVYAGTIMKYQRIPSTSGGNDALDITVSDGEHEISVIVDVLTLQHLAAYAENPGNGKKISRPAG